MKKPAKEPLGKPRQVRFPKEIQEGLSELQKETGLDFPTLVRLTSRAGLPIIKKRFGLIGEEAQAAA